MPTRRVLRAVVVSLLAGLALLPQSPALAGQRHQGAPYPYVAIDVGTLGGPSAYFNLPGTTISPSGIVVGGADTSAITPFPQECTGSDCHVNHAFAWRQGAITDLGALPGGYGSEIFEMNGRGDGVGFSDMGVLDPLTGSPQVHGAVWQHGQIIDLGTLGGNESWASAINNQGQAAGFAANAVPDPSSLAGWGTQTRAFLWQDGVLQDLGTLGGPDATALLLNDHGQVAGDSYINATPNPTTGLPTTDPFLWSRGTMRDLGTLGGTNGFPNWMNSRGEVVGQSNLAGDQAAHPFLWDGHALQDLGTFGGDFGAASWINEAGTVAGWATTSGNATAHAFLWKHGVMTDLDGAASSQCHVANSVNARDQVVGGSCGPNADGWLWEGGTLSDLNTLVAPSAMQLTEAHYINDRGEIAVTGVLPSGDQRVVLLVPSGEANREGLTSNMPVSSSGVSAPTMHGTPLSCLAVPRWQAHLTQACHRLTRGA